MKLPATTTSLAETLARIEKADRQALRLRWLNRAVEETLLAVLRSNRFDAQAQAVASALPLMDDNDVANLRAVVYNIGREIAPTSEGLRSSLSVVATVTREWADTSSSAVAGCAGLFCLALTAVFPGEAGARRADREAKLQDAEAHSYVPE